MLLPKRVKYRRVQRGRMKGKALRGNKVTYGELLACRPWSPPGSPATRSRRPCGHDPYCKRFGKVWIKNFPRQARHPEGPLKPEWVLVKALPSTGWPLSKPGRVMFELGGVNEATAREALRLAANKLPIKCKFVMKETEASE